MTNPLCPRRARALATASTPRGPDSLPGPAQGSTFRPTRLSQAREAPGSRVPVTWFRKEVHREREPRPMTAKASLMRPHLAGKPALGARRCAQGAATELHIQVRPDSGGPGGAPPAGEQQSNQQLQATAHAAVPADTCTRMHTRSHTGAGSHGHTGSGTHRVTQMQHTRSHTRGRLTGSHRCRCTCSHTGRCRRSHTGAAHMQLEGAGTHVVMQGQHTVTQVQVHTLTQVQHTCSHTGAGTQ